ncbi:MAG: polyprenol monophosphomannose synthase [Pseudomonadota bacterium]|nr:polyprenol monophosphomannose synthase [Pseudomonadota bacterium]
MKSLVVLPTYNERENVKKLIEEIFSTSSDLEILVADDNSPDGTAEVVRALQKSVGERRLHLLVRQKKEGLGRAYLASFQWALERGFDIILQMDCDFSHRPADLMKIYDEIKKSDVDFVVGSRYVPGGGIPEWELWRRVLSRMGSLYAKTILGYPLRDWTGGFNAWKRSVLEQIGLVNVSSEGYSFQIEMKFRALKAGFVGVEVPIVFDKRQEGKSKMSLKIMFEALLKVWVIRFA